MVDVLGRSWRCFHCDEVFKDVNEAREHFGAGETADAACRIAARENGLLGALRRAEGEIDEWRGRALAAEEDGDQVGALRAEVARYFKGARTLWEAFCLLDSMEGRVLAAEAQLALVESLAREHGWVEFATDALPGDPQAVEMHWQDQSVKDGRRNRSARGVGVRGAIQAALDAAGPARERRQA